MRSQSTHYHRVPGPGRMHGARRVVAFCFLIGVLPIALLIIPLYLKHSVYADVSMAVAESDVLRMVDGISTVFCQEQQLRMNSSFNAFQMNGSPEISNIRKHIRLKKSMSLPDDTLEYWGFYLPKGSSVVLSVCSRYDGSRILVVKGEKNLRTCGLLEHTLTKTGVHMAEGEGQVRVTFETNAQEIYSDSTAYIRKAAEEAHKNALEDENVGQEVTVKNEIHIESTPNFPNLIENMQNATSKIPLTAINDQHSDVNQTSITNSESNDNSPSVVRKSRHALKHPKASRHHGTHGNNRDQRQKRKEQLQKSLFPSKEIDKVPAVKDEKDLLDRHRRYLNVDPKYAIDGGIAHGGNANNYTAKSSESSVSSFENSLLSCYDGLILLAQSFPPSHLCTDVHFLEKSGHMQTTHEVVSDGYYYYIFYSDNDYVLNDIHAVFNIYKPTYQYANYSKGCINQTYCSFPLTFFSSETVIVEVPTRDGIEHEDDDITILLSSCQPRMNVYVVFPIAVLFLILGCAFL